MSRVEFSPQPANGYFRNNQPEKKPGIVAGASTVAVLDTGYDIHRDTDVARTVLGKNYIDGSSDVTDDDGHGTKVASIILAKTNNGQDIAAVNWKTKVLISRVQNGANEGTVQDLAAAINDVITNPIYSNLNIRVINISLASTNDIDHLELRDAIGNAYNRNVLVVAGAKNEDDFTAPENCFIGFPAAYWQVVSVVAVWRDANSVYHHSYGCNRTTLDGNTYSGVDISAPGHDIKTLMVLNDGSNTVVNAQATSIAAPFVSGTAAAVAACIPNFTVGKLKDAVLNPAQDIGTTGIDSTFGHGLLFYGGTVIYNSYYQNCPSN
ncbi:MAG: S8 family serine peptidase [Candidatus Levybacteria bacterium]|nr:S8 family serine peptidase [Candidatus Levybacteria bacterium]